MSHLPQALERMTENDPSIVRIRKIPVGTIVLYSGRSGSMRQGRTEFPAMVLKQHQDDGSLDMIVFYEAEDMIWEQRVREKSETQPGHCWELVDPIETGIDTRWEAVHMQMVGIGANIEVLRRQMYGDYEIPEKSMIEYLNDFDLRLAKLEAKLRK